MRKITFLFIFFSLSINAQTIYRTPWFYPNNYTSDGGVYNKMINPQNCYADDGIYGYFLVNTQNTFLRQQFYEFNIDDYFLDSTDICPYGIITEMEYYNTSDSVIVISSIYIVNASDGTNNGIPPITVDISHTPFVLQKLYVPLDTLDNNELFTHRYLFTDWTDTSFKPWWYVFNSTGPKNDGVDTIYIDYVKIAFYYIHHGWCHSINSVRQPDSIMSVDNKTDSLIQVITIPR